LDAHLAYDSEVKWIVRVDLDSLVFANHSIGHVQVDVVLRRFGARLAAMTERHQGPAFRVGGDDFVLLIPGMPAAELESSLLTLQAEIALWEVSFGDHPYRPADALTASFLAVARQRLQAATTSARLEQLDDCFYAERCSTNPHFVLDPPGQTRANRSFVRLASGAV
jgi:diguanylate cyclase (GGDEF)-like protein